MLIILLTIIWCLVGKEIHTEAICGQSAMTSSQSCTLDITKNILDSFEISKWSRSLVFWQRRNAVADGEFSPVILFEVDATLIEDFFRANPHTIDYALILTFFLSPTAYATTLRCRYYTLQWNDAGCITVSWSNGVCACQQCSNSETALEKRHETNYHQSSVSLDQWMIDYEILINSHPYIHSLTLSSPLNTLFSWVSTLPSVCAALLLITEWGQFLFVHINLKINDPFQTC